MDDIARETLSGKVTFLLIASVKHFSFTVNDKVKKGYKRLWNYRKYITLYNPFNLVAHQQGTMSEIAY